MLHIQWSCPYLFMEFDLFVFLFFMDDLALNDVAFILGIDKEDDMSVETHDV